jgi:hypothetical protein
LGGLQSDGAKEESGKPKVGPPNHGGFGKPIDQHPVDEDGERDARDKDERVNGFHVRMVRLKNIEWRRGGQFKTALIRFPISPLF